MLCQVLPIEIRAQRHFKWELCVCERERESERKGRLTHCVYSHMLPCLV